MSDDSPYDDFIYFLKSDDSEYMMRRQIEIWRVRHVEDFDEKGS
jgi:hypothetical protein